MKIIRGKLIAAGFLLVAIVMFNQPARADSFELFTASGTFQNVIVDETRATLSGSFVVDLTTGFVVSANLFHGATELNIIVNQGANDPTSSDLYLLGLSNSDGDVMGLVLVAPNNLGSLSNYTGGTLCSVLTSFNGGPGPECRSSFGAIASAFTSHLTRPEADDLFVGSITDAGPAPTPEPETVVLVGMTIAVCILRRCLPNLIRPV